MNGCAHLNSSGFSAGNNLAPYPAIQSDQQEPVFSPAVRFAPKELSISQAIKLVAYWVTLIAITLVMGRSGFSYLRHVSSDRPAHHSVK